MRQPVRTTGTPPFWTSYTGTGDDVIGPFLFDSDLYVVVTTHDGNSDFTVLLISADGIQSLGFVPEHKESANGLQFSAEPEYYHPGVYGLIVEADGAWTLEIPL